MAEEKERKTKEIRMMVVVVLGFYVSEDGGSVNRYDIEGTESKKNGVDGGRGSLGNRRLRWSMLRSFGRITVVGGRDGICRGGAVSEEVRHGFSIRLGCWGY